MALFKKGFLKYLKSGKFADIVVICNGAHYKAHRAILAYSSSYFERLLLSEFREALQPYVTLKLPDPQNVFPELLAFMYTGRVDITLDNVIPLLAVADHYLVEYLVSLCNSFLASNIQRDTAVVIIKNALDFPFGDIIEKCITVIAKNFSHIEADYDFLPPSLFLKLLQHPYLVVRNEYALYELVCRYIRDHPDILDQQIEDMMGTIRFVWMTYEELSKVSSNAQVPRTLIIETCMERLKKFEALSLRTVVARRNSVYELSFPQTLHENDNPRLRPRPPQSYIFVSCILLLTINRD
jgi:BTB/POZ domain/BTB And C-terminal Kelch